MTWLDPEIDGIEQYLRIQKEAKIQSAKTTLMKCKQEMGEKNIGKNIPVNVKLVQRPAVIDGKYNPFNHTTVLVGDTVFGYGGTDNDKLVTPKSKTANLNEFTLGSKDVQDILVETEKDAKSRPYGVTNNCNTFARQFVKKAEAKQSFHTKGMKPSEFLKKEADFDPSKCTVS